MAEQEYSEHLFISQEKNNTINYCLYTIYCVIRKNMCSILCSRAKNAIQIYRSAIYEFVYTRVFRVFAGFNFIDPASVLGHVAHEFVGIIKDIF